MWPTDLSRWDFEPFSVGQAVQTTSRWDHVEPRWIAEGPETRSRAAHSDRGKLRSFQRDSYSDKLGTLVSALPKIAYGHYLWPKRG